MIEDRINYLRAQIKQYEQHIARTTDLRLQSIYKLLLDVSGRELALYERNTILNDEMRHWAQSRRVKKEEKKSGDIRPADGKTLL